ncbi:hypothetical protein [Acidovorax lacteus]|uniref:Lysophosphatidic acid receptor n=1 Tax=Acidovorax lacteus TaxID=1924988 RepID=A0ABP8LKL3_9BURK
MNTTPHPAKDLASAAAGFGLSFIGLGLLWAGVPWSGQFLMALPMAGAGYLCQRWGGSAAAVVVGVLPLSLLLVQFRDASGSHAMPIALVLSWAAAIALGGWRAWRSAARTDPAQGR